MDDYIAFLFSGKTNSKIYCIRKELKTMMDEALQLQRRLKHITILWQLWLWPGKSGKSSSGYEINTTGKDFLRAFTNPRESH